MHTIEKLKQKSSKRKKKITFWHLELITSDINYTHICFTKMIITHIPYHPFKNPLLFINIF